MVAELWTPAIERRYLCGKDDLNLFIGRILRQGEWFFVPPFPEEAERLVAFALAEPFAVRERRAIGQPGGNRPHVADQVMRVLRRRRASPRHILYARGAVRHAGHRTVELDGWCRMVLNAEIRPARDERMRWID